MDGLTVEDLAIAERDRYRAALQEIAGHGCGRMRTFGERILGCFDLVDRKDWCWPCVASEALEEGRCSQR